MKTLKHLLGAALLALPTSLLAQGVGIGTTNPQAALHTVGSVRLDTLAGNGTRLLYTDGSGNIFSDALAPNASYTSANILNPIFSTCYFGPTRSAITVTGQSAAVPSGSIRVRVDITHPSVSELRIYLASPAGDTITLAFAQGGGGSNFKNTVFWDGASSSLPYTSAGAPFTGNYKPLQGLPATCSITPNRTSFGQFGTGGTIVPNGTWALLIKDVQNGNTGVLNNWSIAFNGALPAVAAPPALSVNAVPRYDGAKLVDGTMRDSAGSIYVGSLSSNIAGLDDAKLGVRNQPISNYSTAIVGDASDTLGKGVGIRGLGGNIGVVGTSINTTNFSGNYNYGVYGYGEAFGGSVYGVDGYANLTNTSNDGSSCGMQGRASGGNSAYGVFAYAVGATYNYGIYSYVPGGTNNYAGYFASKVQVNGALNVAGALSKSSGTFKIDHPQDPAGKYLYHSFVESPEMMNVYNGNITTNAQGDATVELPPYFEALNRDFRYQLTPIGTLSRVMVKEGVKGNTFVVHSEEPGVQISWQVTGVRKDAWAEANRVVPEVEKTGTEKGTYLHPTLFGQSEEKGLDWPHRHREDRGEHPLLPAKR